jgi:hypothetical protein
MLLNILVLCVAFISILIVCAWVAGARTTGSTTTAAPAAPTAAPLSAPAPAAAAALTHMDPWQEKVEAFYAREARQALAALDRPVQRFTPSLEPPPQRRFHRPLKAKGRNWA